MNIKTLCLSAFVSLFAAFSLQANTPPTPVCDEFTVVSLTYDGTAKVFAQTFDDGSHDQDGDMVWFKVIRAEDLCGTYNGSSGSNSGCLSCSGLNGDDDPNSFGSQAYFDDNVKFCCDDLWVEGLEVRFRVFDKNPGSGAVSPSRMNPGGDLYYHFNDCVVEIEVQDQLPPNIHCPADLTISCEFEFSYADLLDIENGPFGNIVEDIADRENIVVNGHGNPNFPDSYVWGKDGYVQDNCDFEVWVSPHDSRECHQGVITRVFTAEDQGGRTSSCAQRIFFEDFDPFGYTDIDWPSNQELINVCVEDIVDNPMEPTFENEDCANILLSFWDETFVQDPDACVKILRTWKVLDWCQYNSNTGYGKWEYIQVIKIKNTIAPEFEACDDIVACDSASVDCTGFVELLSSAEDDCSDPGLVSQHYEIDLFYDINSPFEVDESGVGGDASGNYPFGVHLIRWAVADACDNFNSCSYSFEVQDCTKPSPKCYSGIITVIMESVGEVTIWASEFDAGSSDNCGDVLLSFSSDTSETSLTFDCDQLGTQTIEVWVTDQFGNQDFCITTVIIQDNNNVCPDSSNLQGIVLMPNDEAIEGVYITLQSEVDSISYLDTTVREGIYAFDAIPDHQIYEVWAEMDEDPRNGISTLDLVYIRMHLLGMKEFDSPYQYLAADVNNTHSVNVTDMVELNRLLLGMYTEFPDNQSWRFVDAAQEFDDIQNPWPFDAIIEIDSFITDIINADFIGVKVGDVNFSADPVDLQESEDRSEDILWLNTTMDQENEIALQSEESVHLRGFQFQIDLGANRVEELSSDILNEKDVIWSQNAQGVLTVQYVSIKPLYVNRGIDFLIINTKSKSVEIDFESSREALIAEAYDESFETHTLKLRQNNLANQGPFRAQLSPNPFESSTTINIENGAAKVMSFMVRDTYGNIVHQGATVGSPQIIINRADLGSSGVYFLELKQGDQVEILKLICVE